MITNPVYVVARSVNGFREYYYRGRYGVFKWTVDLGCASRFPCYEAASQLACRTISAIVVSAPREQPQLSLPL